MLWNLILDVLITPENIIGFIINVSMLVAMCFVFKAWNEKWWKSLIPFYGTYIIYKHTWKRRKLLFVLQLVLELVNKRSVSVMRKHIITNVIDAAGDFINTGNADIGINVSTLLICIFLFVISGLILFILTRITYLKICDSLDVHNALIKVGVFVLPEIFLLISYIYWNKLEKQKISNLQQNSSLK